MGKAVSKRDMEASETPSMKVDGKALVRAFAKHPSHLKRTFQHPRLRRNLMTFWREWHLYEISDVWMIFPNSTLFEDFSLAILQANLFGSDLMICICARSSISIDDSKKLKLEEVRGIHAQLKVEQVDEIERACKAACENASEETVSNLSHSTKGSAVLEANYKSRHEDFRQSPEYHDGLASIALENYYHGFHTCVRQHVKASRLSSDRDISFLREGAGLEGVPELGKKVPTCILASGSTSGGTWEGMKCVATGIFSSKCGSSLEVEAEIGTMSAVNIKDVTVLDNPAPFVDPFQFEISYECLTPLKDDLEWKLTYVGSAEDETYDQVLESVLVGPVNVGNYRFVFQADPPDPSKIREEDIIGVTVLLLTCSYQGQEFLRVGYYVNNDYDDEQLREEPPQKVLVEKVQRNILADKPRVTKFPIDFHPENNETEEQSRSSPEHVSEITLQGDEPLSSNQSAVECS
ncbi:hypothetical protein BUALT_Bualt05G0119500 [Buddleja alternifolia]|uniref:Uncharacterized protein n=1 Tax=Buddleja alternifolia TaxID=168488 RepID=A0AAV6XK32_9LAMI|nr:hypothetical protein BUALT_Bualt05G0119500 [Buddleja alternifolia]